MATLFNQITYVWWMSGLFVLAGMSTVFALKHRTGKMYAAERVKKLLIPLLTALMFIIPVQTYIADIFYNGYTGSYLEHFKVFFTLTDFSGYDGHFTPAHCWFILYLFVISMITLPLILWYKNKKKKLNPAIFSMPVLLLLFLIPTIMSPILDIGGKSVGEFAAYFLLGYFVLSMDEVIEKLESHANALGICWVLYMVVICIYYNLWTDQPGLIPQPYFDIIGTLLYRTFAWVGILAMLGLGKKYLEFSTPLTRKFAAGSFPLYIFHQSVLVVTGYFVLKMINIRIIQYLAIVILTFIFTMLLYEICSKFRITRFLLGIKGAKRNKNQKEKTVA